MRLVDSSNPTAVSDDRARRLLLQRLVLTTAVCHELQRVNPVTRYRRAEQAYTLLLNWIDQHFGTRGDTRPGHGMEDMIITDDTADLLDELWDGIQVCEAFARLRTADYPGEYRRDEERIRELLAHYSY